MAAVRGTELLTAVPVKCGEQSLTAHQVIRPGGTAVRGFRLGNIGQSTFDDGTEPEQV
jgi:hypothetical protein